MFRPNQLEPIKLAGYERAECREYDRTVESANNISARQSGYERDLRAPRAFETALDSINFGEILDIMSQRSKKAEKRGRLREVSSFITELNYRPEPSRLHDLKIGKEFDSELGDVDRYSLNYLIAYLPAQIRPT